MGDKMNKMMLNLLITWTLLCTCSTSSDVHKRMSTEQLRSIFHVDSHDFVPHYEVIHLTHHGTENHAITKRSIASSGSITQTLNNPQNVDSVSSQQQKYHSHHVKKDLSKSSYYSNSKRTSSTLKSSINNLNSASINIENSLINNLNQTDTTKLATQPQLMQQNHRQLMPTLATTTNDDSSDDDHMDDENIAINTNSDDKITNKKTTKTFEHLNISDIKEHNVSLSAFGDVFNLTLRPNEQLFKNGLNSLKMFAVNTNPNSTHGLDYEPIEEDPNEHIGEVFQDEQNMAAILMRRQLESGDLLMEGSIGSDFVIKPVPFGLINAENGDNLRAHHIVYKRKADPIVQLSDFAYMEPDRMQKRYRKKRSSENNPFAETHSRTKRAIPHIIYPEILVIVDYDGYRLHGGDNTQIKRYFVSFWNGVDLRYRLLKGPRIRISIAGIIISRGRDATPYLERNRVGRDAIDSAAALTDMGKYLFRERRLPVYDIAVAITKLDMCRRNYPTDVCNRGTAGFAYVGGACVVNKRLEKVNSVAIIEDTGGFSGIIVAAHEVGHLLGAVHDGSPPPSYLGGPGAEKCRWEDGYIMSDLRHTERGFRWSPCTIQSFHHFLNGDTASCLHNAPHEDDALGRALPGTLLSLDAQCRRDRGTSACFKDERVCAQLFCFDAASGYCVAYRPAAEGSPCGDGSHCLDGRCVAEHENIIPDYSQHTPSYANPNTYQQQNLNTESYNYHADPMVTTSAPVPSSSPQSPSPIQFNNQFNSIQPEPNPFQSTDPFTPINDEPNNIRGDPIESTTERFEPYHFDPIIHSSSTTTTTSTTPKTTTKTTASDRPTINPFYYGIHNTKTTRFPFKSFSTTKSPYNFDNFQHNYFNDKKTTSTVIPPYFPAIVTESTSLHTPYESFTTKSSTFTPSAYKTPPTTRTTTIQPPSNIDTAAFLYSSSDAPPLPVFNAQPTIATTTRNPIFDLYLKRLSSTTKSPYDFGNLGQYFKTTTLNPRFPNNLFGAHSIRFNSTLRLQQNHQR